MPNQIRLNAFDMNCVGHQSPGLWSHPRDQADRYNTLDYWVQLACLLERGKFDALFLADVLGIYDVYSNGVTEGHSGQRLDQVAVPLRLQQTGQADRRANRRHAHETSL